MSLTKIQGDVVANTLALRAVSMAANVSFANTRITANGSTGNAGQILLSGGATSNVYWGEIVTKASRITVSNTTSSIANGASATVTFPAYEGYVLYKIQTSGAAWVRIYANTSTLSADSSRTEGTDPSTSGGVIAEAITTGSQTIPFTPAVLGFNDENPVTNVVPVAVMNKTGSTGTVTVTLTLVAFEG